MNAPTATEKRLATDLQRPTGNERQQPPTTAPQNADGKTADNSAKVYKVGEMTIQQIIAKLSMKIKPEHLKQKKAGNSQITFLPWYNAIKYLDYFAPGWSYEVRAVHHIPLAQPETPAGEKVKHVSGSVAVVVRLTIPTADGPVFREATGIEDDDKDGYGDPTSNAESMALRRAAAKFGLGLYLYEKK